MKLLSCICEQEFVESDGCAKVVVAMEGSRERSFPVKT